MAEWRLASAEVMGLSEHGDLLPAISLIRAAGLGMKTKKGPVERRRAARRKVRLRVRVDPGALTAITDDVSAEGVFVRSARVLNPGTRVDLQIFFPTGFREERGVVCWSRRVPVQLMRDLRGGMGIRFESSSDILSQLQ